MCLNSGEICIGGPIVTAGYWKMPEKTAEDYFEEDGVRYFRTGDVGQWEADGALRIIDRKCYISSRDFRSDSHFIENPSASLRMTCSLGFIMDPLHIS